MEPSSLGRGLTEMPFPISGSKVKIKIEKEEREVPLLNNHLQVSTVSISLFEFQQIPHSPKQKY